MSAAPARVASAPSPLAEAERLLDNGAAAEAAGILTSIIATDPRNVEASILLARAAIATGQVEQAFTLLRAAKDRASGRQKLKIRLLHGWIYFDQKVNQKAKAEFSAVYERRHSGIDAASIGDAVYGLARLLLREGRTEAAFAKFEEALQFAPRHRYLLLSYASALAERKDHGRALAAMRLGIADGCADPMILNRAGNVLQMIGLPAEAIRIYEVALKLLPGEPAIRNNLGVALYNQGRYEEADPILAESLRHDPNHPVIRHVYSALRGVDVAERASDEYVATTFDAFAASFDQQLVGKLAYRAPEIIGETLAPLLGDATGSLDVLDLGCGTGLCGPILRPFARRLAGIDLSERMLEKARERGVYDELEKAEITAFLARFSDAWDLVVAGDVLVYFGALDAVFAATHSGLRRGGRCAFTVEREDGAPTGWRLTPSGRYAHGADYLRALAQTHGFSVETLEPTVPRHEGGKPVAGYVVVLRRD
jgi:predicted TPR repeat methyltransferase